MSTTKGLTRRWALIGVPAGLWSLCSAMVEANATVDVATAKTKKQKAATQPTVPSATVASVNGLGVRLFAQAIGTSSGNTVISPLSLAVALQMAAAGAGGATEQVFGGVLGFNDSTAQKAGSELASLLKQLLKPQKSVTLRAANGIWLSKDAELNADYAEVQRKVFHARIESRDFADPHTIAAINRWFAEKTNNLIPEMLPELPAQTQIVLANALYFKGRWQETFKAELTKPGPFQVAGNEPATLPLMNRSDSSFLYRETDQYQAIRLPFAGRVYEMLIALPKQGIGAAQWAKELDEAAWSGLFDNGAYRETPGELTLPRLKLTTGSDIRPSLEAIGLKGAFGEGADFSRMSKSKIQLDQVVHRTALTWDETGAEAAAATAIVGVRSAISNEPKPFKMVVDRPFVLALRHASSGAAILLGLVNNPGVGVG
ncbi:serpin family protein [Rhodopseudomonas palustris]|uniref:serpin family protein n=1 Tax=Rhodopseudomonas palustris TaxID=1076 RepID=UPI0021F33EA7|nr:serpin family protein [Rhodopseudomonas palustris]UYO54594.1 hypothetical protein KQX61_04000 [Rhodopseudomonas palustris]